MNPHHAARATAIVRVLTTQRNTQQSGGLADAFAAADVEVLSPSTLTTVIPAKAAIGFTHLWPAISRPSTAHTPLAREAGRGRGPLRSNGRVRGVPVTSFFAAPRSHIAGTSTRRPSVRAERCTKGPGAPHPPNALGPSLSPLPRGQVYRR